MRVRQFYRTILFVRVVLCEARYVVGNFFVVVINAENDYQEVNKCIRNF